MEYCECYHGVFCNRRGCGSAAMAENTVVASMGIFAIVAGRSLRNGPEKLHMAHYS